VTYQVRFTDEAVEDLHRLYAFLLAKDLELAEEALDAIEQAMRVLERFPFSCRKAADGSHGPFVRELIIPFGSTGYVVLFEIDGGDTVTVLAVRHQRESDYY
jgi:plasmid stabilization system protein ParE